MGLDYRTFTELGKQTIGGHKQNVVHSRSLEKGVVFPQKTKQNLPVSVQGFLLEAWVDSLASGQTKGREHSLAHQQKIGLKIY